jgi:hypothetical protein
MTVAEPVNQDRAGKLPILRPACRRTRGLRECGDAGEAERIRAAPFENRFSTCRVEGIFFRGSEQQSVEAKERRNMRKSVVRKKPSLFKRFVMGPPAAILAAAVGGTFSLTAAILPRFLPSHEETIEPAVAAQERIAIVPISVAVHTVSSPPPTVLPLPTSPPIAAAPTLRQPDGVVKTAVPIPPVPTATPVKFKADSLVRSFERAEARSPARTETPRSRNGHRPNLTYGVWTIFASKDARGTIWNNSTLKITKQQETPDGLQVVGFLDWRANGKCAGREYVVGNYVEDSRSLFIEGKASAGCDRNLALSACSAKLSEDGRRLTGGTWSSASARHRTIPGRWEAQR